MAPPTPPPITYTYRVFHLPTTDPIQTAYFAGKFSTLHLSALQTSAGAFGSTFARESAWNASQWVARLQRPLIQTFIAVAYPSHFPPEQQTLETGDWIGCATCIGPTPFATYDIPDAHGPALAPDAEEDKWHMTFVYNEPAHRRKGVTKLLIEEALRYSEARAQAQGKESWMRIFLHPDNLVVMEMYAKLGFEAAGLCTYVEAVTANGDADLMPDDCGLSDLEKYHTRLGFIMMRRSNPRLE